MKSPMMAQYIPAELSNAVNLLIGLPEQFTVGFVKISVVVPSGVIFAFIGVSELDVF